VNASPPSHDHGAERLGAIPSDQLTDDHRRAIESFRASRGIEPFGPFVAMLWSPEVMARSAAIGEYLRFNSAFPPRLSEFMILVVARHWNQQYEWTYHYPIALRAGVDRGVADAIGEGRRPGVLSDEEELLYDFCTELTNSRTVSDAAYNRLLARFGERGVVEAITIVGYYGLLALVLNVARTPPVPGVPALSIV
jgi:4-carboxymuconolactone decarboxylase